MLLRHFLGDWGPVNISSDNHGLLVNKKIWVLCYVQGASLYRIVQNLMPLWAWVVWKSSSAYFPKGDRDFLYAMIKFQKSLECDLPLSFLGQNYNERSKASEPLLINRYIIYAVWYLAVSRRSDTPVGAALTIDLNGRVPRLASAALFTALLWSHVRKLITTTCFRLVVSSKTLLFAVISEIPFAVVSSRMVSHIPVVFVLFFHIWKSLNYMETYSRQVFGHSLVAFTNVSGTSSGFISAQDRLFASFFVLDHLESVFSIFSNTFFACAL